MGYKQVFKRARHKNSPNGNNINLRLFSQHNETAILVDLSGFSMLFLLRKSFIGKKYQTRQETG